MELNAWIDSLLPPDASVAARSTVAAERLGEKRRTVDSWRRFENPPSFKSALNIIRVSGGVVDFNGIYNPFVVALMEGRSKLKI